MSRYAVSLTVTVFGSVVIALTIGSLCVPWLSFDGRVNNSNRSTINYFLTKVCDKETSPEGNSTRHMISSYGRWKELQKSNDSAISQNAERNYKTTASVFAFIIFGLAFQVIALVLSWARGSLRKVGVILLYVELGFFTIALCLFLGSIRRWYPFYYTNMLVLLDYGTGFWIFFVNTFVSLWGATSASVFLTKRRLPLA